MDEPKIPRGRSRTKTVMRSRVVTTRVEDEVYASLEQYAIEQNLSLSEAVRVAVITYIDRQRAIRGPR